MNFCYNRVPERKFWTQTLKSSEKPYFAKRIGFSQRRGSESLKLIDHGRELSVYGFTFLSQEIDKPVWRYP